MRIFVAKAKVPEYLSNTLRLLHYDHNLTITSVGDIDPKNPNALVQLLHYLRKHTGWLYVEKREADDDCWKQILQAIAERRYAFRFFGRILSEDPKDDDEVASIYQVDPIEAIHNKNGYCLVWENPCITPPDAKPGTFEVHM